MIFRLTLQSGFSGPKDKRKKRGNPNQHSQETDHIVGTSEKAASRTVIACSGKDASSDIPKYSEVAQSDVSPPLQDVNDNDIQSIFATPGLSEHRYISLMEYSVLRAFVQNAGLLAIDLNLFLDDDALSPWTVSNPYPAVTPHDLNPTPLQLSTPHHPYLDMIALPSLRDNVLLAAMTEEQEDQLCHDMHCGFFTIWGSQPWNALGM